MSLKSTHVSLNEFENAWSFKASKNFISNFHRFDFEYTQLNEEDTREVTLKILVELEREIEAAGPHRLDQWEKGWGENLTEFNTSNKIDSLAPKYFSKYPIIRWRQNFISPRSSTMEQDGLKLIIQWLVEEYAKDCSSLYEFGCGTGSNLVWIRELMPDIELTGLDWARSSQEIIDLVSIRSSDAKLQSKNFDYFKPDFDVELKQNSAVLTVASLEQTGKNYSDFLEYLLAKRPKVVIHIEPMWDSLDPNNLLDYLSIRYMKKRNYLDGFREYIWSLSNDGKIEVKVDRRTYLGSLYIDGYSVLVWKPRYER
jgi:trans-aconitate methyltransferase